MSHLIFKVFLYEPQIPQNTGNIGRLCVGLQSALRIVGKPSFSMEDKERRRAGLDYWTHLDVECVDDAAGWKPPPRTFAVTKFAKTLIYDEKFREGDSFLFGRETTGLPASLRETLPAIRLPMDEKIRSFNLANSVAMVLSEAHRQVRLT